MTHLPHYCPTCGWEGTAPEGVAVVFHPCPPSRRSRRWTPPDLEGTTPEETWARVFSDAYGGYKPPTAEEARTETGEYGRRKDGTGRSRLRELDS